MSIQIIEVEIPVARIAEIVVTVGPQGPPGAPIVHSATPPDDTDAVWFDTTSGVLSVWYVDAWVAFDGVGSSTMSAAQITDALQGAEADPTRIGAEYLPEELEGTLQLADTGASAEDAGALGLDSSGRVVLHDDDRNGDDLPHFIDSRSRTAFYKGVLSATLDDTLYSVKLCDIPLSAAEATTGNQFYFEGKISVAWDNTNHPDFAYLALVAEGQSTLDIATDGYYFPIGLGVTSELIDICGLLTLADDGANWKMAAGQSSPMAFIRRNSAGAVTHAVAWKPADDIISGTTNGAKGADAQANNISLYLVTFDESAVVNSGIKVLGNIALEQV